MTPATQRRVDYDQLFYVLEEAELEAGKQAMRTADSNHWLFDVEAILADLAEHIEDEECPGWAKKIGRELRAP